MGVYDFLIIGSIVAIAALVGIGIVQHEQLRYHNALSLCLQHGGATIKFYERPSGFGYEWFYYCLDSNDVVIGRVVPVERSDVNFVFVRGA